MTMSHRVLLLAFAALIASPLQSQNASPTAPSPAAKSKSSTTAPAPKPPEGEGQRIFEQNCNRCHNTPEGFSPHISGTIVRHMRVRTSLSQHDEQELLRFFNP